MQCSEHMVTDRDGIVFQHRRLEGFVEELLLALEQQDRRQCETAAFRLQGGVNAHFAVEAQVIFPALRGRRPELTRELDELEHNHEALGAQLEALCKSVFASDTATVRSALADFHQALTRHEEIEEALLGRAHELAAPATDALIRPKPHGPIR